MDLNYHRDEIVSYRIERALETLEEAKVLASSNHWNTVANKLYYACFYIIITVLFVKKIRTKSHSGTRTNFSDEFVKRGLVKKEMGSFTETYSINVRKVIT
jgi:uncharacterized protein (UPF0332 family)